MDMGVQATPQWDGATFGQVGNGVTQPYPITAVSRMLPGNTIALTVDTSAGPVTLTSNGHPLPLPRVTLRARIL